MKKQFCILLTLTVTISSFAQGNLTPTGPPGATMKTLAQIQPRTPISSVPFTITNSGSYYLTTNLVGINGIIISTNSVTLDLNGFWLNGLGGIGKGIDVTYNSAPRTNIAVFNGNVSGFGGIGVDLSSAVNSRIERVQVSNNGGRGLRIRDGGLVMACVVSDNGDFGMQISSDCAVTDCIVRGNQTYGIVGDHNNTIRHCSVLNNDGSGIWLSGNGSHISDCTVNRNTSTNINTYAIRVAEGSSVTDYTVRYNHGVGIFVDGGSTVRGCTVDYGDSDGIVAIGPSVITGNSSTRNGTGTANSGIRVSGANSKIEGNTMAGNYNTGLLLIGSPNLIIGNTSQNHGTNYNISILNKVGQILDFTGSSSVIITNANPWANIQF